MYTGPHAVRLRFITGVIICLFLVLWVRVGVLQAVRHDRYYQRLVDQSVKPITIAANRGAILDRNGVQLATNLPSFSYGVRPKLMGNLRSAAQHLSEAAGMNPAAVRGILATDAPFVWLIRQTGPAVSARLDRLGMPGLEKIEESRRHYPFDAVGAQVIGYTDIDGCGIEGVEVCFEAVLANRNGKSQVLRDALGQEARTVGTPTIKPRDGCDVVLAIDRRIQEIADEELEDVVGRFDARWGGAIVLNPETGEVLAMSNVPLFDPNAPGHVPTEVRRNRLVADMIEPGSTFKIVVFSEALESGVVREGDLINCENGKYRIAGHTINDSHELGLITAADVLIQSSNIGSVKIGERVGSARLYKRARSFGFGTVSGIEFPSETGGNLPHPRSWSKLSLPTISFGQGVAVSPLQLALAYSTIANGGLLMKPILVREVVETAGRQGRTVEPQVIRRVMTEETARRLTDILCGVVERGTGMAAAIPNVRIAGKTGTAQRPRKDGPGYEPGQYISSFIGFVADREPRLVCLVMVDSPKGLYYGSQVAAPVFKQIVNRVMNLGNEPNTRPESAPDRPEPITPMLAATVPDLRDRSIAEAVASLRELGLRTRIVGDSTVVARQVPEAGAHLSPGGSVTLYSPVMTAVGADCIPMPDLRGQTVREAVRNLVESRLKVNISGSGIVQRQTPDPGSLVKLGTVCVIACGR